VHLNVDYPFRLQGILYFPKLKQDFGSMEGQIKLYSGQVFVADNIKEVIPEFLMLLKGVLDCPDFPLNVSRSFLQNDGYVRKLSAHITKKVADRLTGMFTTEREQYEKYWNDIHPFIKFGCMRDAKFYERMQDALLFGRTDGGYLTLTEYLEANKDKAPGKVYYTNDAARQDATIALYRARNIDVVKLDSPIDVNFISFMEYSGGDNKASFARVDADVATLADASGDGEPEIDVAKLETLFRKTSGLADLKVEAKPRQSDAMPAMLVEGEQSRRFKEMSRFYGEMGFSMPDDYTLILNRRSPTVVALSACADEARAELLARQLYDLAQLANAPLKPEDMTAFLARSQQVVALLAQ
jgi:molecular chaperone HtpG